MIFIDYSLQYITTLLTHDIGLFEADTLADKTSDTIKYLLSDLIIVSSDEQIIQFFLSTHQDNRVADH